MYIELFQESRVEISITVTAHISNIGDVFLEGSDSGDLVRKLKGDSEYEYKLSVKKLDLEVLIKG